MFHSKRKQSVFLACLATLCVAPALHGHIDASFGMGVEVRTHSVKQDAQFNGTTLSKFGGITDAHLTAMGLTTSTTPSSYFTSKFKSLNTLGPRLSFKMEFETPVWLKAEAYYGFGLSKTKQTSATQLYLTGTGPINYLVSSLGSNNLDSGKRQNYTGNIDLGYRFTIDEGTTISPFLGYEYSQTSWGAHSGRKENRLKINAPHLGFRVDHTSGTCKFFVSAKMIMIPQVNQSGELYLNEDTSPLPAGYTAILIVPIGYTNQGTQYSQKNVSKFNPGYEISAGLSTDLTQAWALGVDAAFTRVAANTNYTATNQSYGDPAGGTNYMYTNTGKGKVTYNTFSGSLGLTYSF